MSRDTNDSGTFDPYHRWLGIPPNEQPTNHYRLLGLSLWESDANVIESAADRQMAHVRSFAGGPHSLASQRLLNELSAAKLCLLDAAIKAAYDTAISAPASRAPRTAGPRVTSSGMSQPVTVMPTAPSGIPAITLPVGATVAVVPVAAQEPRPQEQSIAAERWLASEWTKWVKWTKWVRTILINSSDPF